MEHLAIQAMTRIQPESDLLYSEVNKPGLIPWLQKKKKERKTKRLLYAKSTILKLPDVSSQSRPRADNRNPRSGPQI